MKMHRKIFVSLGVLLAATLTIVGVGAQSTEPACEGEYLESVRELGLTFVRAVNAGDLDPWYDLLTDDYEGYYSEVAFTPTDKDGGRASTESLMEVFPGFQTEIHMSIVSSDCRFVTYYWTSTGTFDGPLGDIPPNGNEVAVSGINITEVADGKIVHEWTSYDLYTLLTQMGILDEEAVSE